MEYTECRTFAESLVERAKNTMKADGHLIPILFAIDQAGHMKTVQLKGGPNVEIADLARAAVKEEHAYAAVVAIAIAKLIALGEERSHPGSGLSDVTIDAVYFFLLPANSIGVFFMTILCMDRDTPRRIKTARYVLSALHAVASPTVIFVLLVMVS